MVPKELERVLSTFPLPALPESAMRLLEVARQESNGPPEFALAIESDPGLASQLLRFVNSSYFGFAGAIAHVRQAIALVGTKTVLNFVLWSAVFQSIPRPRSDRFAMSAFWIDSIRRAVAARHLAQLLQLNQSDEVFIAALLQDIAVPLLTKHWFDEYHRALWPDSQMAGRLSQRERQLWGWTHAEAGRLLLQRWGLPDQIGRWIEQHIDSERLLVDDLRQPSTCVAAAALLPSVLEERWYEYDLWESLWSRLEVDTLNLIAFLERVDTHVDQMAQLLRVTAPCRPLVLQVPSGAVR